MRSLEPDYARTGEIIEYTPNITKSDLGTSIISSEIYPPASDIKDAAAIVCGGGGCKTKEGFEKYVPPLAESLGKFLGQEAMVGASRMAVESGFIDRSRQIGQTGQTVKPRVYIAIGVSGAVQHLIGMQNSDIVLAINKDPNARIFKVADYGIVGDLEKVVPELIKVLNSEGSWM
jgi:electron transfer flavoprotein alpha subunit